MIMIFQSLCPISMDKNAIIFKELDRVDIFLFVTSGSYDIGYVINNIPSYRIRRFKGTTIGLFNICFDRRMIFNFKAHEKLEGFFIRLRDWKKISKNFPLHYQIIKRNALLEYVTNTKRKLDILKKKDTQMFMKRSDYRQLITVND